MARRSVSYGRTRGRVVSKRARDAAAAKDKGRKAGEAFKKVKTTLEGAKGRRAAKAMAAAGTGAKKASKASTKPKPAKKATGKATGSRHGGVKLDVTQASGSKPKPPTKSKSTSVKGKSSGSRHGGVKLNVGKTAKKTPVKGKSSGSRHGGVKLTVGKKPSTKATGKATGSRHGKKIDVAKAAEATDDKASRRVKKFHNTTAAGAAKIVRKALQGRGLGSLPSAKLIEAFFNKNTAAKKPVAKKPAAKKKKKR